MRPKNVISVLPSPGWVLSFLFGTLGASHIYLTLKISQHAFQQSLKMNSIAAYSVTPR